MHIIPPTRVIRSAAEAVSIGIHEMVPVEGEDGLWRLPTERRLSKPEVVALVNLYNDAPVCKAARVRI
jgi:hypothetical protein